MTPSNGNSPLPLLAAENTNSNLAPVTAQSSPSIPLTANQAYDGQNGRWGQEQPGIDFKRLFSILRRRYKVMLAAFIAVVALVALITLLTKPIYQSSATLLLNTSSPFKSNFSSDLPILGNLIDDTQARSQETQIEVIKSRPVRERALKQLSPADQELIDRYSKVTVTPVKSTDIITVGVETYRATSSAALAQQICDAFIAQNQNKNRDQVRKAAEYINRQVLSVGQRLNAIRGKLRRFKQENNTVDLTSETQAWVAQIGQIRNDLRAAQTARQGSEAALLAAKATAAKLPAIETRPNVIVRRPVVEELKRQLTALQLQQIKVLQKFTPTSPEALQIAEQINQVKKRLTQEAQTEVQSWSQGTSPIRQQALQSATQAQSDVWNYEARIKSLSKQLDLSQAQLAQLPDKEYRLSQIVTDMATLQQTYQLLNTKYQSLRISESADTPIASIVDPAQVPLRPISPNKTRNMVMGVVLGLMAAVMLALILERLDGRVHAEEDVYSASGLSTLAQIPLIQNQAQRVLLGNRQENSMLLECYRMLRTSIEFASIDQPIKSLVVTSTQPGEGKSQTSTDLAIAIALDGKKVILVDTDLRRPSVHRLLELDNHVGFTNVVMGNASLQEALQPTSMPNLRVVSSGTIPPNPPELLNSKAARAVMQEIIDSADFVVIDTPPALLMVDAAIMCSMADGAILVVSLQDAKKNAVARTTHLLSSTGTKILGTVLNKVTNASANDYGDYKEYFRLTPEFNQGVDSTTNATLNSATESSKATSTRP